MELAVEQRRRVHETPLSPSDLFSADEVFITSSVREVVPVVRVDDVTIGSGRPGPVTQGLLAAYRVAAMR